MAQEIRFPQYPTVDVAVKAYEAALARKVAAEDPKATRKARFAWQHLLNQAAWKGMI